MSPFQAVCTALAGTVGTGNIAGVAGAGRENAMQRFVLFKLEDKAKSSEDAAARRD